MIAGNLNKIRATIPSDVTLVAVSKFHPAGSVREAYNAGQRVFGESRVQELTAKAPALPDDIQWHFIGHLQTNKVAQLLRIPNLTLIHSVDSDRLLRVIDREAAKAGITAHVLLELHVAAEETKSGFSVEELEKWMQERQFESLQATHIHGIMAMASNTDDTDRIHADFQSVRQCFKRIISDIAPDLRGFEIISMGMSHDYNIAVEEGSSMVRIGTSIFGERIY